jgi:Mn2+/Fe2+ NRAMP family transporter
MGAAITGAAFLMATSAIGPGFLTQTAQFTSELASSFGFVIFISLLLDIGAQLNIWRVITVSRSRAQDLADRVLPGLGTFLAILVGFGGLVFNVGNFAGTGLGLNALTGIDPRVGAGLSCLVALGIFWSKEAIKMIDHAARWLGIEMIALTVYVAIISHPPVAEAFYRTVWPEKIDLLKIITLVGGTVGGYISFAGAHRLLDGGIGGTKDLKKVTGSSVTGIVLTSLMRFILFLAALGVVSAGFSLDHSNPAGSVFRLAAGQAGYVFFGLVMWCAAITSVIGASYTSVSFFRSKAFVAKREKMVITIFLLVSALVFIIAGNPVMLLILAGAFNGLVLPLALAIVLLAAGRRGVVGNYRHPLWLTVAGWMVVVAMGGMGIITIRESWSKLF